MTIIFTEQELEWIDKKLFDWKLKDGCPDSIRSDLERKLKMLRERQGTGMGERHGI